MKDVADAWASLHLDDTFFHKTSFELVAVRIDEFVNEHKHNLAAVDVEQGIACHRRNAWLFKFIFFVSQCSCNLRI